MKKTKKAKEREEREGRRRRRRRVPEVTGVHESCAMRRRKRKFGEKQTEKKTKNTEERPSRTAGKKSRRANFPYSEHSCRGNIRRRTTRRCRGKLRAKQWTLDDRLSIHHRQLAPYQFEVQ